MQLPANLRAMNSTNIEVAKQARGIAGPLLVLGGVVNDAIAVLGSATNGSTSLSFNAASLANSVAAYTDVLHNASFASHGPLYFFAKLAGLSNLVEPSEAGTGDGVFVSAAGKAWSGNRVCLVDTCVSNTVIAANRGPLSVSAITGGSGGPSISVSRETLFFLPYLIPVIREWACAIFELPVLCPTALHPLPSTVILIATVAALGFWGKTWQCYPACCSAIGICIGGWRDAWHAAGQWYF